MYCRRQELVFLLGKFTTGIISKKSNSSIFLPSQFPTWKKPIIGRPKTKLLKQKKKKILNSILSSDISPFLDEGQIFKLSPFVKKKTSAVTSYSFVIDCAVAEDIVNKILSKIECNKSIIIEGNPGLGLISLYLIKSGVPEIHIYEDSPLRSLSLDQIIKKHPEKKFEITTSNIFADYSKLVPILNVIGSKVTKLPKKIIGVTPNYRFFSTVVSLVLRKNLWGCIHLTEFYVVISFDVYHKIIQFKKTNGRYFVYCMFNFIFETEIMGEYPSEAFLPFSESCDKMYLIRITKKADNFIDIRQEDLPLYMTFITILGKSTHKFIIPTLEHWLPDCGPYLISKGISLMNRTRDISASESVKLFKLITMCDGYENLKILNQIFKVDIEM